MPGLYYVIVGVVLAALIGMYIVISKKAKKQKDDQ